jgi:hypothetical protein
MCHHLAPLTYGLWEGLLSQEGEQSQTAPNLASLCLRPAQPKSLRDTISTNKVGCGGACLSPQMFGKHK